MKLTPEQIKQIQYTVSANGVKYYDVELELTDHLIEEIETEQRSRKIGIEKNEQNRDRKKEERNQSE